MAVSELGGWGGGGEGRYNEVLLYFQLVCIS